MTHLFISYIIALLLICVNCEPSRNEEESQTVIFSKHAKRRRVKPFFARHRTHLQSVVDVYTDTLQPNLPDDSASKDRPERQAVYDDFNPFSDVDETISNAYTDIQHSKALEVAIDAAQAQKAVQAKQISVLQGTEKGLKEQLHDVQSEMQMAKQQADMDRRQEEALEYRLVKEVLLNKAHSKELGAEIERRKSIEDENKENIRKLIELQNEIRHLRLANGDTVSDCIQTPCLNGGVCLSKQPAGHECLCPNDFTGVTCQIPTHGHTGFQFSLGATISIRELGSDVVVMMPVGLMILLTIIQIASFLTCVIQCCLLRH